MVNKVHEVMVQYKSGKYDGSPDNCNKAKLDDKFVSDLSDAAIADYNLDKEMDRKTLGDVINVVWYRPSVHSFENDLDFVLEQHKRLIGAM